jgi:predicted ABC-type ATPase
MTDKKPNLIVIAGANGAGKSTLTRAIQKELQVPVIDPDREAARISPNRPELSAIAGGRQALIIARNYLKNDRSFAVETTLSGNTYLKMMKEAKQKGWQVLLIYVGVNNVELNIDRVAQRVARGGHNVPQEDIRRRYERSLANLPKAIERADSIQIFDNSTAIGYQQVLAITNGTIVRQIDPSIVWGYYSSPVKVTNERIIVEARSRCNIGEQENAEFNI